MPSGFNEPTQTGSFRAMPLEWGFDEAKSGALAIKMVLRLDEVWAVSDGGTEEEWCDWRGEHQACYGYIWIVGKEGKPNETGIQQAVRALGWDGKLDTITDPSWVPTGCQVSLKQEEYNGQAKIKAGWFNHWFDSPGGMSANVEPAEAKAKLSRFAGQFVAIAANELKTMPSEVPPLAGDGIPF